MNDSASLAFTVNDIELLPELIRPAAAAALLAVFIHTVTVGGPRGFRIFPSGEREWVRYWLRSVIFMAIGSTVVALHGKAHPLTPAIAGGFLILSVLSCMMSYTVDRSLCFRCTTLTVATFSAALLWPAVSK